MPRKAPKKPTLVESDSELEVEFESETSDEEVEATTKATTKTTTKATTKATTKKPAKKPAKTTAPKRVVRKKASPARTSDDRSDHEEKLDDVLLKALEETARPARAPLRTGGRRAVTNYSDGEAVSESDESPEPRPKKSTRKKRTPAKKSPKKKATPKEKASPKKGPGRPRKTPKKERMERLGVVDESKFPDSLVELVYDQPAALKKLSGFFKQLMANMVEINFTPTKVMFFVKDHTKTNQTRVVLEGDLLPSYFCKRNYKMTVDRTDLDVVFGKVDKTYDSAIFIVSEPSPETMKVVLENDMGFAESHDIAHVELGDEDDAVSEEVRPRFDEERFMIQFTLGSKFFKKMVTDLKLMTTDVTIKQDSVDSDLSFEYQSGNNKMFCVNRATDPKKIKLVSRLKGRESAMVEVRVDHLKPISQSQVSEESTLRIHEDLPLMTLASIDDGTITIRTLTETKATKKK
jgi:hypothetical protein